MHNEVTADALLALCSCPDHDTARRLAQQLVKRGWSACVQILPGVTSIYRWQGKVCQEKETLLVIKTTADTMPILTEWLISAHPYTVPEVIALPITAGSREYIDWLLSHSAGRKNLDEI